MTTSEKDILSQIKRIIIDREPTAKIYLYGSRARGTAKPDSDWDLLILLNKESISLDWEREITYPLYDLEFDSGEVISPLICTENEWNTKYCMTPFYNNIIREGRLIWQIIDNDFFDHDENTVIKLFPLSKEFIACIEKLLY